MAKQIIDLPGTRVDTLYTTVESGTNEDGTSGKGIRQLLQGHLKRQLQTRIKYRFPRR